MAKHAIIEAYTFSNTTSTVNVTGKNLRPEQLLLITDVTTGTVIYNFSDPSLKATSITNTVNTTTGLETCNVVLNYNCSALSSTDKLSILYDESYDEIKPYETLRDPVDKMRVSEPQALIDTDFEYGIQPTKWEGISLLNNRPSAFYDPTAGLSGTATTGSFYNASGSYTISNITSSTKTVTLSINNTTGITVGLPIFIVGTLDPGNCDGWWLVETVNANTSIVFTCTNAPTQIGGTLFDATKTYLYIGGFYTGAAIPSAAGAGGAITLNGTTGTVTTTNAHGLRPGDGIYVVGTTGATGLLNSSWVVSTTPNTTTFTFACTATGTITGVVNASIYGRSLGYIQPRAWDGGVQFTNCSPYHGYQVVRQTRRYFRYQSGKGIQFSTGSAMKPALFVNTLTSSASTTVTVTTKYAHGLLPGAVVQVSGSTDTAYNGNFTVVTAPTATTFTYTALSIPTYATAPGFPINVTPYTWYGSSNRVGMFDSQNGFFYEYDGQTLYAVRRNAVRQGSGSIAVTTASQSVAGTGTLFSQQFKPGDQCVIRGQTYFIEQITSDTQMYIYPEYRGTTNATNCVISKVVDTRTPQTSWNIDTCNGLGASYFNVDLTRMQMFYMDYTWYGAGAIRFGFKNNRGEVIYCHRMPNNNVNFEAYLRSGNLPARYETSTLPPNQTYLTANLANSATTGATISLANISGWPTTGTVALYTANATVAPIEYITYTAANASANTLTIGTRAVSTLGNATAQTFTVPGATAVNPGGTAMVRAEMYSPQQSSTLSHWGSSVIMDGKFDADKSYVFNYGQNAPVIFATAGTRYPVFSIRLAPSVDNGLTGLIGSREILNRMQIIPASTDVYVTTSAVRVELILNGRVSTGTFAPVGGSSLTQYASHGNTATITGGESVYTFFATPGAASNQDLTSVRDLGTSILSGGNSLTAPTTPLNLYPDGPDILTLCVTPLAASANVAARLNWAETQA
jgi:hypothetical protein